MKTRLFYLLSIIFWGIISCSSNNLKKEMIGGWAIELLIYNEDSTYLLNFYSNVISLNEDNSCQIPSNDESHIYNYEGEWSLEENSSGRFIEIKSDQSAFFNQIFKIDTLFEFQDQRNYDFYYLVLENDNCKIYAHKPKEITF